MNWSRSEPFNDDSSLDQFMLRLVVIDGHGQLRQ
jgi:hypothetical protein